MAHDQDDRERAASDAHWAALARYLNGDAPPEQRAAVERWAEVDENRRELAELRALWQLTGVLPSPARVDDLWRDLVVQMRRPEDADARRPGPTRAGAEPTSRRGRGTPTRPYRPVVRSMRAAPPGRPGARTSAARALAAGVLAAGVLVAAGVAGWWRTHAASPSAVDATALAARDVTTGHGQRRRVRLEDGTVVDLAPGTRLHVRASERGARDVDLQGEALFTVTHDARRPFLVHTRDGVAEDLGTTFTVRALAGDATTRVVVLTGRVSLRAPHAPADEATALHPGQLGVLRGGLPGTVATGVDTAAYAAWVRGRLLFRQAPLRAVAEELARWYDVDVRIPDARVAARRVTLDMPARSLGDVLAAVTVPLGLRAVRTGHAVVLTAKRTTLRPP